MRRNILVGAALLLASVAGLAAVAAHPGHNASPRESALRASDASPDPVLVVDGQALSADATTRPVDWARPISVEARGGSVASVTGQGPEGSLPGAVADGTWTSTARLLPAARYQVDVRLVGPAGRVAARHLEVMTAPADQVLHATIGAADGDVFGVGEPAIVYFDRPVATRAQRAQVQARLTVRATPPVTGEWHWVSQTEVHFRPAEFWASGTRLLVGADLRRLQLADSRTWGSGSHQSSYRIGAALVSTVDVAAHTMTVRRDGVVLRTLPVSTGRDKYPTKGGVHIVLEKQADQLFDSRTVGIPTASPDGYFEHLPWSVRISDGGAFVHANPGTVRFQGVQNVSHGCVNLSVSDAQWYFQLAKRGDVVDVVHASVGPDRSDPGMADWNVSLATWKLTALAA
ncbi:MAG: L,D-transpeptidase LdtMt2 [Mycobacteriales bacterium]